MKDTMKLTEIDGKFYATARAYIVEDAEDLPREMASSFKEGMNPSFLWVAGRYVQANQANRNGQYWTYDDIKSGEASIRNTPLNVLHKWDQPVGTFVETKIVHREDRQDASDTLLPEIQALGVVWAANFPHVAEAARAAHAAKQLWYSMECVAESKQCLIDEQIFPWRAQAGDVCEHLAKSATTPRRFINPVFLGGALIFPPERPGWKDAHITDVAKELTKAYAHREDGDDDKQWSPEQWESMMSMVTG